MPHEDCFRRNEQVIFNNCMYHPGEREYDARQKEYDEDGELL